jgi:hypothetical protein
MIKKFICCDAKFIVKHYIPSLAIVQPQGKRIKKSARGTLAMAKKDGQLADRHFLASGLYNNQI